MDFDEVPAGPSAGGASNAIPNDDGAPPPTEDDYSDAPFEALLQDGNWKARKAAFDRVVTNAPDVQPEAFAALLPKLVKDVTSPAFDSFAEALAAFLEVDALPSAADVAALVTVAMVDKGLVGRPRAAAAATQVLHNLVRCGQAPAVNAALTKAMAAKAPKARAAALTAAASIVSKYGVEALPLKPLVKTALPLFNDTDAKVRKEVTGLIVECYRYVGAAIEPAIEELRDVQKQELKRLFEEVKPPQRAAANGRPSASGPVRASVMASSQAMASSVGDFDDYDDQPEKPVLSKLSPDFFAYTRSKEKWQDRAAKIENELLVAVSAKRVTADADYTELVKAIRDFINDPQLPISNLGFRCAQALAKSLRGGLSPYSRFLIPAVFDKFKEKKPASVEAASVTIAALLDNRCCQPDHLYEEFDAACHSKLPNHRQAVLLWATRALAASPDPASFTRMTACHPQLTKLIVDDKLEVREAAFALVSKIVETCGAAKIKPLLDTLDDKLYAKVFGGRRDVGQLDSVTLRSTAAAAGPKSAPAVARAAPRSAKPATTANASLSTNSTPTAAAAIAPRRLAATTGHGNAGDVTSVKTAVNVLDEGLYGDGAMDPDVAACILRDHLRPVDLAAADALDLLKSKEWRGRADAAALIETAAAQLHGEAASAAGAAFVAVLRGATQWRENMFQVVNANAKAITQFVVNAVDLSPWATYAIVTGFGPRFAEAKSRQYVIDLLVAVTDHVGPKLVARLLCAIAAEQKSPRTTTEVLDWIEFALRSYVSAPVDAKGLVDFIREHVFEQPNPAAKASGVKVLVALRARVGSRFDNLIGDINPHLPQVVRG
jgi:cytoskeleton-associated protein 5